MQPGSGQRSKLIYITKDFKFQFSNTELIKSMNALSETFKYQSSLALIKNQKETSISLCE